MEAPNNIEPKEIVKLLDYFPEIGNLVWKNRDGVDTFNIRLAGKKAFTAKNKGGYLVGAIKNKSYLAHRVIWAMATGAWPEKEIDHINGIRTDNRIVNLRIADRSENSQNQKCHTDNMSGYKGVTFHKLSGLWNARICINGKRKSLGYFHTPEKAYEAYCDMAPKLHLVFHRLK